MMHRSAAAAGVALWTFVGLAPARAETWAEKLGFPPDKRVLILHADDVGMSYEANQAAKEGLPAGHYRSASAMAPCPWFSEFAAWCAANPQYDVGLHLTLNSEWKYYRWGPTSDRSAVPSLVDKEGCLHAATIVTALRGKAEEVEREIRAQIEKARSLGLNPSHLDSHMGTVFARPDFIEAYLRVAQEYGIPAFVPEPSEKLVARLKKEGFPATERHIQLLRDYPGPKVDDFYVLGDAKSYEEKKAMVLALVGSLDPGVVQIVFHPSAESEAMKHITGTWRIRGWEARLFGDPDVAECFKSNGILQTDWKDLKKRFDERRPAQPRPDPRD